jgi:hypothetical protein
VPKWSYRRHRPQENQFSRGSRVFQQHGLRVFALGQRLRHFADHVAHSAGRSNGERVRRWFQEKKAGWYAVLADPQMPVTSTVLDQAHNAIERKLFMMKGFHHPQRIGNTKPLFRPAAATARLHRRPLRARSDGSSPSTRRPHAAAARSKAERGKARSGQAAQDGLR